MLLLCFYWSSLSPQATDFSVNKVCIDTLLSTSKNEGVLTRRAVQVLPMSPGANQAGRWGALDNYHPAVAYHLDQVREKENDDGKGAAIWIRTKKKRRSGVKHNSLEDMVGHYVTLWHIPGWGVDYLVVEGSRWGDLHLLYHQQQGKHLPQYYGSRWKQGCRGQASDTGFVLWILF